MVVLTNNFTFTPSDMWHVDKQLPFFRYYHTMLCSFAFKLMSEFNGNKMSQKVVFRCTSEMYLL